MIMTIDIGGTKTMCTLWDKSKRLNQEQYVTSSIDNFSQFVTELIQGKQIDCLCFALAGSITEERFELTNTGQVLHLDQIRECARDIPHVAFLNDLEALGHSLSCLHPEKLQLFRPLNEGQGSSIENTGESKGAKAILSIGTGLGISAVTRENTVIPSEGGHVDFAPQDLQQEDLLAKLKTRFGHVSYERMLSGQGLTNLYGFFTGDFHMEPSRITAKALDGDPEAIETFQLFTRILAAACGNFALTFHADGGIYLGGGIIPKILPLLDRQIFEKAYLNKGRFSEWLRKLPVYMILDETAPSAGAAAFGRQLLSF